jgi:uncharacterized membrane-anchored protein YhcB (DUF1043 family)
MLELVERILDSADSSGGGWPVLVLILVIGAIVYLARYVLSRQMRINEQRVQERKQEFEAQLERERQNARNYQETTGMMVEAFNKNSAAMSEFSAILRPMSETLTRIDRHLEQPNFSQRTRRSRGEE